jgi:8-oxo-dGTP pyrophosphatase MutT (NUDIX family)
MGQKRRRFISRWRVESGYIGCGALIYSKSTHRYLFLLRNQKRHAGSWGLVGGRAEDNESPLTALSREIIEEIGIIKYEKTIPLEKFTNELNRFEYHTYLIPVDEEFVPILNDEHRGYAWTSIADHPKPLHPGVWRTFSFKVILKKLETLESIFKDHTLIPTDGN